MYKSRSTVVITKPSDTRLRPAGAGAGRARAQVLPAALAPPLPQSGAPLVAAVARAPSQTSNPPSWPVTTGRRGPQTCFCSESKMGVPLRGGQLCPGSRSPGQDGGAGGRGPERSPCLVAGRRSQKKALKSKAGKGLSPVPGVGDQGEPRMRPSFPSQASGPAVFTGHTPPQLWLKGRHAGASQTGTGSCVRLPPRGHVSQTGGVSQQGSLLGS